MAEGHNIIQVIERLFAARDYQSLLCHNIQKVTLARIPGNLDQHRRAAPRFTDAVKRAVLHCISVFTRNHRVGGKQKDPRDKNVI